MSTLFTTNEYNVSEENLSNHFDGNLENVEVLNLWNITERPSSSGCYSIEATFNVDDEEFIIKTKTNNMQLIDAWKSGSSDMFEDGDDGFDDWNEVVESMLNAIKADEKIAEFIED